MSSICGNKDDTKMSIDTKNEDANKDQKDDGIKQEEKQESSATDGTRNAAEPESTKASTGENVVEAGKGEKPNKDGIKAGDEDMKTADKLSEPSPAQKAEDEGKQSKDLDDEAPKTFPQILMEILGSEEESDTIAWLPHGRSFIIYKKKTFAQLVLPRYFKATKFTSFTRKLNRWGFTRVTRGPEMGSYYHKLFLRDEPSLCLRMSSHSSSKFQEQQQLMPNPMGGMPFGSMPFPMAGMMPGMMNPMNMNPADINQQNQLIQQQLQQLQWQQFQLQQLQQQQQQGSGMNGSQQPHHLPQGHPQQGHPQGHQQPAPGMMHGPPPTHPHGPGGQQPPHGPNGPHMQNPHGANGHVPPGPHSHPSNGQNPVHANGGPPHHQVQAPHPQSALQQAPQSTTSQQQQQGGNGLQQQRPPQMMVHQNQNVQSSQGRDEIVTM